MMWTSPATATQKRLRWSPHHHPLQPRGASGEGEQEEEEPRVRVRRTRCVSYWTRRRGAVAQRAAVVAVAVTGGTGSSASYVWTSSGSRTCRRLSVDTCFAPSASPSLSKRQKSVRRVESHFDRRRCTDCSCDSDRDHRCGSVESSSTFVLGRTTMTRLVTLVFFHFISTSLEPRVSLSLCVRGGGGVCVAVSVSVNHAAFSSTKMLAPSLTPRYEMS